MPMLSTPGPTISTSVPGLADFLHCAEITTRAKLDTSTARGERTGRCCSHRHHHARHAKPIDTMCAARPGSARAKRSSKLQIHAATRNQSTLMCARHSTSKHSPAQARARAIASASGRRAKFLFDQGLAGTQPIRSESSTRLPCANATHARKERGGAAQRRETLKNVPRRPQSKRTGRIRAASSCICDLDQRARSRMARCPRDLIHSVLESRSLNIVFVTRLSVVQM